MKNSQRIDIRNWIALRKDGRGRSPKGLRLGFWVLAGLGMMIFLFSGCGSESTPGGTVKKKNASQAESRKSQGGTPLLKDQEGIGTGNKKIAVSPPDAPKHPDIFPGITNEEMEAKANADRKKVLDSDDEIFPGMTRKQYEAKAAADQQKVLAPDIEIFPGMTRKQYEAKVAADQQKVSAPDIEIFPGMTRKQYEAKVAADQQKHDPKEMMQKFNELMAKERGKAENRGGNPATSK
jgi:hypothetical protein